MQKDNKAGQMKETEENNNKELTPEEYARKENQTATAMLVTLVVLFIFIIGTGYFLVPDTKVPNVIGMPAEQAKKKVEKAGFDVNVVHNIGDLTGIRSTDYKGYTVVETAPEDRAKDGTTIKLIVKKIRPKNIENVSYKAVQKRVESELQNKDNTVNKDVNM